MTARLLVLPLGLLVFAGCEVRVDTEERVAREEKRFTVSGQPDVRLSTFDGAIEIRSWDKDEVLVEIEKRAGDEEMLQRIEIRAEQQGNRIEVDVRGPSDSFRGIGIHISPRARLLVSVPGKVTLQARTSDGAIRADRIEGKIELRTSDGSVRADQLKGQLDIDTRDGSITIDDMNGEALLATDDGGISVSGVIGALRAHSGDGSITVRAERGTTMTSDWLVDTDDGAVAVYLPPDFAAEVDAETRDGRVRSEFTLAGAREDDERRRSLRGKIGAGGRLLRVRSGDGSIVLREW
jgi:hypothetical protein